MNSCSEPFSESFAPGSGLISKDVVIRDTTIQPSASSSFRIYVPMDSRLTRLRENLVGSFDNRYVAYTLIQFLPGGFPHRDTIQVVSAKLTLHAIAWFGDSSAAFGFTAHKINQEWSQFTVTWDSIQAKPNFFDQAPIGSYSGMVRGVPDTIVMNLDTALVRKWFLPRTETQYGILLKPTQFTNVVRSIHGFDVDSVQVFPTLQVIASNQAGTGRDTTTVTLGADSFVGNIDNLNSNPELLYAQAGVVYRSRLRFDVSFLGQGTIINSAELLLDRDPATTVVTRFTADTVVALHVLRGGADSTIFEAQLSTGRLKQGTVNTFSFNVRHAVQFWTSGTNDGLLLRQTDLSEYSSFDLYTFFSEQATNPAVRPRLIIKYTVARN